MLKRYKAACREIRDVAPIGGIPTHDAGATDAVGK
jgi:hypothetical protein